jgi:hypothetical protein
VVWDLELLDQTCRHKTFKALVKINQIKELGL